MKALDRKLFRDLWHMKGQAVAIAMVIASGVAVYVQALTTLTSLEVTRATFYDRSRFADVFAGLKRAPKSLTTRIADIPGVAEVQTRIQMDVNLDVPSLKEPAVGRLISVDTMKTTDLNTVYLREGRRIDSTRSGEVLVSEAFAEAHGLHPGDSVNAVINGSLQTLNIVGVALSPEYIFQIRGGDILPDDRRFGVFWMDERTLAAAFNMEEAFNNVTLKLLRGANEPEVLKRLDLLLEPYGGISSIGRKDQLSNRFLSDEIRQLKGTGQIVPIVFLGVAAFLLNIVLSRIITTQREQIAAIKAFGYRNYEIGLHYFKLASLIALLGIAIGTGLGFWLAQLVAEMYAQFYRFPVFYYRIEPSVIVSGTMITGIATLLGTWGAVRKAINLPPAEAMRPEAPAKYKATIMERMGLGVFLSSSARMVIRNLERRPLKAAISSLGIALAVAILVLGMFGLDSINYLMDFQFQYAQRHDLNVTFVQPAQPDALHELEHLPGVFRSETFRAVPARLVNGPRHRQVGILGLQPNRKLFRIIDERHVEIELPEEGLVLSEKLAEIIGLKQGDDVTVEVQEGERPTFRIPVVELVSDFSGLNAYMDAKALNRLMKEDARISGAFLSVNDEKIDELYTTLKKTPKVAGVSIQSAALQSFQDTFAENMLTMVFINVIFSVVISLGVVYNTARISFSERSRELATLRVVGFTKREVYAILAGELAMLTSIAIPLGLAMGYLFAGLLVHAVETDLYRLPLVISPRTYGFAALVVLVSTIMAALLIRQKIDHLDLVAVLKSRE